jgi:hypothetical protein
MKSAMINFSHNRTVSDMPRDVRLTEDKAEYQSGEEILCTANGNPLPVISWKNKADNSVLHSAVLPITEQMSPKQQHFQCIATNVIENIEQQAIREISFYVDGQLLDDGGSSVG